MTEKAATTIDPTKNVMSLVAASNLRQDDLRIADTRRIDDLREQQAIFDKEMRLVRAEYERKLAEAESKRIDAMATAESRRLDAVLASMKADVALASEKASATAATLAATVSDTRNTLDKRLAVVEQNQYQQGGAKAQQTEGQMGSRWVIQTVITIGLFVLAFMLARMWPVH